MQTAESRPAGEEKTPSEHAHIGPALGQYYHSIMALCNFAQRLGIGPELVNNIGGIYKTYWANMITVLDWHWHCIGSVRVQYRLCSRPVSRLCSRPVRVLYRLCSRPVHVLFASCIGPVRVTYRFSSRTVPVSFYLDLVHLFN